MKLSFKHSPDTNFLKLCQKGEKKMTYLKTTSNNWQKVYKDYFEILDPDGWWKRRGGFHYSWYVDKIDRQEFIERMSVSICRFKLPFRSIIQKGKRKGVMISFLP